MEFMEPLCDDMIQDDPTQRPTIDVAVSQFEEIRRTLSTWKLRSRLVAKKERKIVRFVKNVRHIYRTVGFVLCRHPALPTPEDCRRNLESGGTDDLESDGRRWGSVGARVTHGTRSRGLGRAFPEVSRVCTSRPPRLL